MDVAVFSPRVAAAARKQPLPAAAAKRSTVLLMDLGALLLSEGKAALLAAAAPRVRHIWLMNAMLQIPYNIMYTYLYIIINFAYAQILCIVCKP